MTEQSFTRQLSDLVTCDTSFWLLLGKIGGLRDLIRSIGWLYQALAPICLYHILRIALVANQYSSLFYLKGSRRLWLKVCYVDWIRLTIVKLYNTINRLIGPVRREFGNDPGDLASIPGRVIPKTLKMVLDTSLLNTQQYKVRIEGKIEQSRERSSALPYTLVSYLLKREPSGHPRLKGDNFTYKLSIFYWKNTEIGGGSEFYSRL